MISMTTISEILRQFGRKDGLPTKDDMKNESPMGECIYPTKGTVGNTCRNFNWIHSVLKYKMFIPFMHLAGICIGKRLVSEPEKIWHNRNLRVFDKSWRDSMQVMAMSYNPCFNDPSSGSFKAYDMARKLWLTVALHDTATKEFTNVFCHTLAQNMAKEYKGHKTVNHVYYSSKSIYDVVYFKLGPLVFNQSIDPELWRQSERLRFVQELRADLKDEARVALANEFATVRWLDLKPGFKERLALAIHLVKNHKNTVRIALPVKKDDIDPVLKAELDKRLQEVRDGKVLSSEEIRQNIQKGVVSDDDENV